MRKKKTRAAPSSHHQLWRKTQVGSTRKMRWSDDEVEALGVQEEGVRVVAAVLGVKQWRRHSLNSCPSLSPCRHTGTGRTPPV